MAYELMTYYESQGKDGYDLCLPWGNMVPAFEWCSTMFDLHFHCIADDLHHVEWTRAWQPIYFFITSWLADWLCFLQEFVNRKLT
jgi:hypothetical protein